MPAARKTKRPRAVPTVQTMDGQTVPAAELSHIAPLIRPFAVRVDSLKRDPKNARLHSEGDLPGTAQSLRDFGQQPSGLLEFDPKTRVIKIGNGRHQAAESVLGWTWIAAVPSDLTAGKLKAFSFAHNRTAEKSEWDVEALGLLLDEIKQEEPAIDLAAWMSDQELQSLIDGDFEAAHGFAPKKPEPEPVGEAQDYAAVFKLIISCDGEKDQVAKIKKLKELGWEFTAPNVT